MSTQRTTNRRYFLCSIFSQLKCLIPICLYLYFLSLFSSLLSKERFDTLFAYLFIWAYAYTINTYLLPWCYFKIPHFIITDTYRPPIMPMAFVPTTDLSLASFYKILLNTFVSLSSSLPIHAPPSYYHYCGSFSVHPSGVSLCRTQIARKVGSHVSRIVLKPDCTQKHNLFISTKHPHLPPL